MNYDTYAKGLIECKEAWCETTKRKGMMKVCRDMFITSYKDKYIFGIVRNGDLKVQISLSREQANKMIDHYGLEGVNNSAFRHAMTYRTPQSNNLVRWLLDEVKKGIKFSDILEETRRAMGVL